MSKNGCSEYIRKKVADYSIEKIVFTKKNYAVLFDRVGSSENDIKREILNPSRLIFAEKQEGREPRYRCYFIYSNSRGRCYVLSFNSHIRIITIFPLGRKTLNKYRKRFK